MNKLIKIVLFYIIIPSILHFSLNLTCNNCYAQNLKSEPEAAIVLEVSSGRILFEKDINKQLPIASTTKILTAIIAIENCEDLDKKFEVKKEAVGIEGSSIYLRKGEMLSTRELLFGLMLRSGNDAAVQIAINTAGSVEKFVRLMNEYSKKLNLQNSNFVTVNGLHDENHYSSALDLAKITSYALKNKVFSEIVSTKEKIISNDLDKRNKCRLLKNKNKLLTKFDGADGVKTGYTTKAGKCFVGSATRNGMQLVCVVLNSPTMFDDCERYLDKCFNDFKIKTLLKKGEIEGAKLPIKKKQNFPILLKNDINLPLKDEEMQKIYMQVKIKDDLKVPIFENQEIGTVEIYKEKDLIFSDKIYTINIEEEWTISDYIGKIVQIF